MRTTLSGEVAPTTSAITLCDETCARPYTRSLERAENRTNQRAEEDYVVSLDASVHAKAHTYWLSAPLHTCHHLAVFHGDGCPMPPPPQLLFSSSFSSFTELQGSKRTSSRDEGLLARVAQPARVWGVERIGSHRTHQGSHGPSL